MRQKIYYIIWGLLVLFGIMLLRAPFVIDDQAKEELGSAYTWLADEQEEQYVEHLQKAGSQLLLGNVQPFRNSADPEYMEPAALDTYAASIKKLLAPHVQNQVAFESKILGYNTHEKSSPEGNITLFNITLQYYLDSGKVAVVGLNSYYYDPNNIKLTGLRVNLFDQPLEDANQFTFDHATAIHYIFLLLYVTIPIFILYSLWLCMHTDMRRKWLWFLFIAFGLFTTEFDWSSGVIINSIIPDEAGNVSLKIALIGAEIKKMSMAAPTILGVGMPLGAIIFLLRRKKLAR